MDVRQVIPRDAIPSIDDPQFADEHAGEPDDEVVVVDANPPRAYPLRILDYHEIVNDWIPGADDGGESNADDGAESDAGDRAGPDAGDRTGSDADDEPIAVTWCPLCGAAVVYDRQVGDRTLTFGVTVGRTGAIVTTAADGVHVYERPTDDAVGSGDSVEPVGGDRFRVDGTTWDAATGESEDGRTLDRLPARRLFAFAWRDDHGDDAFYE